MATALAEKAIEREARVGFGVPLGLGIPNVGIGGVGGAIGGLGYGNLGGFGQSSGYGYNNKFALGQVGAIGQAGLNQFGGIGVGGPIGVGAVPVGVAPVGVAPVGVGAIPAYRAQPAAFLQSPVARQIAQPITGATASKAALTPQQQAQQALTARLLATQRLNQQQFQPALRTVLNNANTLFPSTQATATQTAVKDN